MKHYILWTITILLGIFIYLTPIPDYYSIICFVAVFVTSLLLELIWDYFEDWNGYRLDRFPSAVISRPGSEICMTKIGANANGSSIMALANRDYLDPVPGQGNFSRQ